MVTDMSKVYDSDVPDTDNGAYLYRAVFDLAHCRWPDEADLPYIGAARLPELGEAVSPTLARKMRTAAEARQPLLDLLQRARTYRRSDYHVVMDRSSVLGGTLYSDVFQTMRTLKFLCLNEQVNGTPAGALDTCDALLDIGLSFRDEPDLATSSIRALAMWSAADMANSALSRTEPAATDLLRLRDKMLEAADAFDLQKNLEVEIVLNVADAFMIHQYLAREAYRREQEAVLNQYVRLAFSEAVRETLGSGESTPAETSISTRALKLERRGLWAAQIHGAICPGAHRRELADRIRDLLFLYDQAQLPSEKFAAEVNRAFADQGESKPEQAIALVTLRWVLRAKTHTSVAATALSVEAYRARHGRWPERLADVQPAPPADPFSGDEMIYKATPKGRLVYSIGENQRDDLGERDANTDTDDIVFRLLDVRHRNVPAAKTDSRPSSAPSR